MNDIFVCKLDFDTYARELAIPVAITCKYGNCHDFGNPQRDCKAIFDTGATASMISSDIANELGLIPYGTATISGVHGTESSNIYIIDMIFRNGFKIPNISVSEAGGSAGFDLLIGMDIISKGTMLLSGAHGRTFFYFAYPSQIKQPEPLLSLPSEHFPELESSCNRACSVCNLHDMKNSEPAF